LGLGIGCGVLVVLCCGCLGISGYMMARSFQPSEDPAKIQEITDSIVDITVPPELAPRVAIDWVLPVVGRRMMVLAVYGDKADENHLVLLQFGDEFGSNEAFKQQWEDALRESGHKGWEEAKLEESEEFKTEINGQPATFNVGKGKEGKSGAEVWQAMGSFQGKAGPAMLFVQLRAANFTKEQLLAILQSMK
jgi:hypothetical protein